MVGVTAFSHFKKTKNNQFIEIINKLSQKYQIK